MKNILLLSLLGALNFTISNAQVGIGTTTPKAFLNVPRGQTVLFGEDSNYVNNSSKLIWYGSKGALRAGYIGNSNWNSANVGDYSFATGYNTTASGYASAALGQSNTASGYSSFAMGSSNTVNGNFATAMGSSLNVSGYSSMATGQNATASGYTSRVLGYVSTASGDFSTAIGDFMSTDAKKGSFAVGDHSTETIYASAADNQMMMRFAGGYVLYSNSPGNQSAAVGVQLPAGGNAWTTISDSTRKENFRKADGASFLQKITNMRLGSWNYKGQDAKLYRHYGPMAQDFFAAFGKDELGIVGEEKSINQADFDGVNLIAIQALIQEVNQLKAKLIQAEQREQATQARLNRIEALLLVQPTNATASNKP